MNIKIKIIKIFEVISFKYSNLTEIYLDKMYNLFKIVNLGYYNQHKFE